MGILDLSGVRSGELFEHVVGRGHAGIRRRLDRCFTSHDREASVQRRAHASGQPLASISGGGQARVVGVAVGQHPHAVGHLLHLSPGLHHEGIVDRHAGDFDACRGRPGNARTKPGRWRSGTGGGERAGHRETAPRRGPRTTPGSVSRCRPGRRGRHHGPDGGRLRFSPPGWMAVGNLRKGWVSLRPRARFGGRVRRTDQHGARSCFDPDRAPSPAADRPEEPCSSGLLPDPRRRPDAGAKPRSDRLSPARAQSTTRREQRKPAPRTSS